MIGGGAVGAACARELAARGRQVLVLDRGTEEGQAWRAAAGMLAAQTDGGADDPLYELGLAGRELIYALAPELEEATGIKLELRQDGIAKLGLTDEDVSSLKSKVAWQRQQGHLIDWLDATETRTRYPWAGKALGALWAPHDGAIDPRKLVEALLSDAKTRGARIEGGPVVSLLREGDRVAGVQTASGTWRADQVVIAAGAWSGRIEGLPRPLSVEPVRGQMAAFPWPKGTEEAIIQGAGVYIVPRGDEAIVGSTMEASGFRAETTPAGLASLFARASALVPALAHLEVRRTWAGLRPGTPDGLPIIGREPRTEGLWYATGHGREGILLSVVTGRLIAQLITGETPMVEDLSAVRPERFWKW
ncbi:MAG TPA: glycine oxidase ThiO [Gemmatimonadales bacterium]|nr:glycine oxidase ThiO [Gemmatimonadales bacterium]